MATLILSVIFSISASAYDVEVDGIYYNLVSKAKIAEVTKGDNNYSGSISIPSSIKVNDADYSVTRIGQSAFSYCSGLTSVTIPNSMTSIEEGAFSYCSSLTSITISNSVTSIGKSAFSYCSRLKSITIPNSVTKIGDCIFEECSSLTSITIPESVTSIGSSAFYKCSSLTSITIPNTVTSIGWYTFSGCSGLTSITIPNTVTIIGDETFYNCSSLTSITVPNSVTSIGYGAFSYCSSLTSITIPNSVASIEYGAFCSCSNLENFYCYAENFSSIDVDIFKDSYIEYATLHVPSSAISYYQTTAPWSGFGTIKALESTDVGTKKCETPTISFADGELVFICATEGVEYVSEIKSNDINKFYTEKVSLTACYDISVTATKSGFSNSDVATAKLYWLPSSGSLDETSINNVSMRGIAIQSDGGFITISGLDNNETVSFYATDGKNLGFSTAINGTTFFTAQTGSVVIAKIGNESIKILVK